MKPSWLATTSGVLLISSALTSYARAAAPPHGLERKLMVLGGQVPLAVWIVTAILVVVIAVWVLRPRAERDPPNSVFGGRLHHELAITGADIQEFEGLVQDLNEIWRAQDMAALHQVASSDMAARLATRLQTQLAQDKGWVVHELQLLRSELIEAWSEGPLEHAQMNMRLSTLESAPEETPRRFVSREIWSFERSHGSHWRIAGVRSVE